MSARTRALIGAFAWVAAVLPVVPNVHHGAWAQGLLLFAALVLVPLLLAIVQGEAGDADTSRAWLRWAVRLQLPAALLLVAAFRIPSGVGASLCAIPWAATLGLVAAAGVVRAWRRGLGSRARGWCGDAGLVYAAVGAAWLLADRSGLRPLGFSEDIVLLTAVHFHYAGLLLPVLAGRALAGFGRGLAAVVGTGVVAGVPAVAVGITLSQLGLARGVEISAALLMAAAGIAVAGVHLALALQTRWGVAVRCLWVIAGVSLAAGMALAALYALRGVWAPWPWLDIPWMRALHGTVNALGFGFCATLAWWRVSGRERDERFPAR